MTAERTDDHAPDAGSAQATPPDISATALLEEVRFPLNLASTVNVTEEGDGFVYTIVTQSPNTQESKDALAQLSARGCTVAMDHESMENFSIITVVVPSTALRSEQTEGIRREIAQRAAHAAEMATKFPAVRVERELIDPAGSC